MRSEAGEGRATANDAVVARSPVTAPAVGAASAAPGAPGARADSRPVGFFRRYRLPLALAAIALCLYAGSIVYILYGRGPLS